MDLSASDPVTGPVRAGDLLWTPTPERVASANMTAFMGWLKETRGLEFTNYPDLWQWSVTETAAFWQAIWDYNDVIAVAHVFPQAKIVAIHNEGWEHFKESAADLAHADRKSVV